MAEPNIIKTTTNYVRKLEENYGTLRRTLYEATFEARGDLYTREALYGDWSKEYQLGHARFSALYTIIEDAGMEEDYQAWKKKKIKMQMEGTDNE